MIRIALFFVLVVAVAACSSSSTPQKTGGDDRANKSPRPADIGKPLFTAAAFPNSTDGASLAEPIRVACHITVLDKVDVPTREEGTIQWLGVQATPTEIQKLPESELFVHKRPGGIVYRRLRLGEIVTAGKVVALLDDERAALEQDIAISNIRGAEQEYQAAKDAIEYYKQNVKIEEKANSSVQNIVAAKANLAKSISEAASKDWQIKRATGEESKAKVKLDSHLVRAPITGRVVQIYKWPGEGVKVTEPILQIQQINRLGVEGYLEVQYAGMVQVDSEVFVEPDFKEPPLRVLSPHSTNKPITAIAVGMRNGQSTIVSASEDGWVRIWNRDGKVHGSWKHAGPVRAVACTRIGVQPSIALTGCDDGKARLWSLDEMNTSPAVVLDGHHEGGVQAAAFSPDGDTCVTSDDRGDIFLWNATTGKKIYTFPREHNSTVTSLQFTPQCKVVSAGRDPSSYVWNVGDKSADVELSFEHRSGEVPSLGVSDDGGQMLLDLDKSRLRVVDLSSNRNLGTLNQAVEGGKFATFALFSPAIGKGNDRVILTAGGSDGVLQMWRWTNGIGRGSELRKLVCSGYVGASCAAFSPVAKDGFIVAGTRKGDVHIWNMPTEEDLAQAFKARITFVDANRESSGRTVRVYAEFDNAADAKLRLHPGTTANLTVPLK